MKDYSEIDPLQDPVSAERQKAKRHYGVHPYFTRRPFNVVRRYITHYSREGDVVIDPFGGSGVTAIEAWLENRTGVQNDINPLANFIAQGVHGLAEGRLHDYRAALEAIRGRCQAEINRLRDMGEPDLQQVRRQVLLPPNFLLPKSSDVRFFHDLFTPRQLLSLALLKEAIESLSDPPARRGMLLAWSATLAKLNKTFLSAEGRLPSRGGSSIFSIYRYKIAKKPVELPAWEVFEERANNVVEAKAEVDKIIEVRRRTGGWRGVFQCHCLDFETLARQYEGKADYVFTDPPYGGHISYLDLSTLWNGWLDTVPNDLLRTKELIVGGEFGLSEESYVNRLRESMGACVRMLKPSRWLSVVFQHWSIRYFEAILSGAAEYGAELRAAISQVGDPIWSMHKKKGSLSVLAGELILTFAKTGATATRKPSRGFNVPKTVAALLAAERGHAVYGEAVFNKLIIAAWRSGAISELDITKAEFSDLMRRNGWNYDEIKHCWRRDSGRQLPLLRPTELAG
jgi:16S rRNA G966 N2-methylase RsmD